MLGLVLRPCTPERRAACREETPDDAIRAWNCSQCTAFRPEDLHPYTAWLLRVHRLARAGFPLERAGLRLWQWEDLGAVAEALEQAQKAQEQKQEAELWRAILKHLI